ncbi:eukaryotic translation initiation factor 3 subunit I-like [Olea europaea subsp. europaea]|uniref:Eukaryotic translation initiation factor 3 subunit I-like n=1 Tax=Olea europaea subsp. europaea TaxID=158383 RepID=A0A8S0VIW3_OLEEU|nr:eukaryotic translation initiation factor 3 subunit I-like [Olea europaea subsp. europaea]
MKEEKLVELMGLGHNLDWAQRVEKQNEIVKQVQLNLSPNRRKPSPSKCKPILTPNQDNTPLPLQSRYNPSPSPVKISSKSCYNLKGLKIDRFRPSQGHNFFGKCLASRQEWTDCRRNVEIPMSPLYKIPDLVLESILVNGVQQGSCREEPMLEPQGLGRVVALTIKGEDKYDMLRQTQSKLGSNQGKGIVFTYIPNLYEEDPIQSKCTGPMTYPKLNLIQTIQSTQLVGNGDMKLKRAHKSPSPLYNIPVSGYKMNVIQISSIPKAKSVSNMSRNTIYHLKYRIPSNCFRVLVVSNHSGRKEEDKVDITTDLFMGLTSGIHLKRIAKDHGDQTDESADILKGGKVRTNRMVWGPMDKILISIGATKYRKRGKIDTCIVKSDEEVHVMCAAYVDAGDAMLYFPI